MILNNLIISGIWKMHPENEPKMLYKTFFLKICYKMKENSQIKYKKEKFESKNIETKMMKE